MRKNFCTLLSFSLSPNRKAGSQIVFTCIELISTQCETLHFGICCITMKELGNSKPVRNRTTIFSVWWEKPTLSFWRKFYCHILLNQIKTTYLAKLWTLHPTHDSTLLAQESWGAGGFRTTPLSKILTTKNICCCVFCLLL